MLKSDIERLLGRKVKNRDIVKLLVTNLGVVAIANYRLQAWFFNKGLYPLATWIRLWNNIITGADFAVGCKIGKGLIIKHPNGIVVGGGVVIGENCILLHQVTLGEKSGDGSDQTHAYPTVLNNVVINAGAKLIGNITVGDNAIIGANAVVIKDVPANSAAVGIPARNIISKGNKVAN